MDLDNEDYRVASKGKPKSYEVEYESLSQAAVEKLMQRDVDHICGILGVDVRLPPSFFCTTNQCFLSSFFPGKIDEHSESVAPTHQVEQGTAYREIHG